MINAIMFDLDGTLIQSEKLKSLSYAIAVQRLRGLSEPDQQAIEAYREIVGAARDAASRHITESLDLDSDLRPLMTQHDANEPWEVLTAMRTEIYDNMVADPQSATTSGPIPSACCALPRRIAAGLPWRPCRIAKRHYMS